MTDDRSLNISNQEDSIAGEDSSSSRHHAGKHAPPESTIQQADSQRHHQAGESTASADQENKPAVQSSMESDKDIKAREKNLKLAEAVAPPPPSISNSSLTTTSSSNNTRELKSSSIQSSDGRLSNIHSDAKSKRNKAAVVVGGGGKITSSSRNTTQSSQEDRSPLRYSTDHHAAKHAKARQSQQQQQQPSTSGPGAIRVATATNSSLDTTDYDYDDVDEEAKHNDIEAIALTAEAVDDDEEEENRIRQLRESNEALRKQVELALQGEQRALEEMQTMAQAPPASVSPMVIMGDHVAATAVIAEGPPPPPPESSSRFPSTTADQSQKCCWNICKGTVFMTGCCCIFCLVLAVVVIFAAGLDELIADSMNGAGDGIEVATRRSNLKVLLQPMEPLHEEAFNWLVETDQWQPPDQINNATEAPSDQGGTIDDIGTFVGRITNASKGSTVGTGERKWMLVERYYLAVLYFSTNGDNWIQNFGWLSETSSHCAEGAKKWFGIECENDSVVSIELEANNLDGSFPRGIRVLSNLRSIWITGDGSDSKLIGTVPTMPQNLTQLWLWNMRLTGSLPDQLYELSGLTSLRLYENELSGAIPNKIFQLSDLRTLELVGNQFTGAVPVLPNVTSCDLSSNKFSDTANGAAQGCLVFDQNP
ncbi:unnamed protein product [Cylindrotheca closterium]|uniref:L domain-like protein n=1 Tax=Cylindrotheca closterium TaxID=2856 RepID=A0AAD2FNW8_9STRA|nr:unnamed protein product [Cylindrotheca closterium]